MSIWAIADLHLSFGVPTKSMEVFGPKWNQYTEKIKKNWEAQIQAEDLVLIPGDISWAMKLEEAMIDLKWIDQLPGTKLILRGNHDYWWPSKKKLDQNLPPSISYIHNNAYHWKGVGIAGTRLWDCPDFSFEDWIEFQENPRENLATYVTDEKTEKIFERELVRLKLSLDQLHPDTRYRIVMTHYPPIDANLTYTKVANLLENYGIQMVVFGHLHNVLSTRSLFGEHCGIKYILTSCDYLNFNPIKLLD